MPLDLKDRIGAIVNELNKAIAERWVVPISGTRVTGGSYKVNTKIGQTLSEPTVQYIKGPVSWQPTFHSYEKRRERLLHALNKTDSKKGSIQTIVSGGKPGPKVIPLDVKFATVPTSDIDFIIHTADKRVKIAETKMGHLVNRLWLSDKNDLDQSYDDIDELQGIITQYIILDDAWRFQNNIERDDEEFENLLLFRNTLENFQMAYSAVRKEEEIPDDVYEAMSFEEKINSFALMHDNWDGEGAKAVTKSAVRNALHFLKQYPDVEPCFVCATYEGKVGIDFKNGNLRLETQIISAERIKCLIIENGRTIIYNEIIHQSEFPEVLKLLKY